jgi:DNA-binding GntR family transcriptional regulator
VLDLRATRSVKDHSEILRHVKSGDVEAAGASMERHLTRSFHELVKQLTGAAPTEDPFDFVRGS